MIEYVHHSTDLDLTYDVYVPGKPIEGDRWRGYAYRKTMRLRFEDGGTWTLEEALYASWEGLEGDDLRAIHAVKRIFGGDLQTDRDVRGVQRHRGRSLKRLKDPSGSKK